MPMAALSRSSAAARDGVWPPRPRAQPQAPPEHRRRDGDERSGEEGAIAEADVPLQLPRLEQPVLTAARDFPVLALNTAGLSLEGSETATRLAFEAGITNIDFHPGIERDGVARVLASSPTLAARAFLTTKIAFPRPGISPADAAANCRSSVWCEEGWRPYSCAL